MFVLEVHLQNNICIPFSSELPLRSLLLHFIHSNYSIVFVAAVIKSSELRAQKARPAAAGATKKRQGDYDSALIQSNSNRVDPDNPLEMFFYSEMKREDDDLMDETNKEHENSFEIVDMERIYDTLFEILWYIPMTCFDTYYIDNVPTVRQHDNARIKSWKGVRIPCSKLFTVPPTDRGRCCSFNSKAAD